MVSMISTRRSTSVGEQTKVDESGFGGIEACLKSLLNNLISLHVIVLSFAGQPLRVQIFNPHQHEVPHYLSTQGTGMCFWEGIRGAESGGSCDSWGGIWEGGVVWVHRSLNPRHMRLGEHGSGHIVGI